MILKGENISGQLRYGYVKDPNDKHKIIVDPEAAEVVNQNNVKLSHRKYIS